jgi:hypothetical protein
MKNWWNKNNGKSIDSQKGNRKSNELDEYSSKISTLAQENEE